MTSNAIPRISGLDPSRPCFSESDRPNGLQRGDAQFVDIIHSNIAVWGLDPIGDADFYPNGSVYSEPNLSQLYLYKNRYRPSIIQRGCWSTSCRRVHAYQFYVKTVYPGMEYSFNTTKCESFRLFRTSNCGDASLSIPLGFSTPHWARGTFFLTSLPDSRVPFKKHCNEC